MIRYLVPIIILVLPLLGIALLLPTATSEKNAKRLARENNPPKDAPADALAGYGKSSKLAMEDMRRLHIHIKKSLEEAGAIPNDYCQSSSTLSAFLLGENMLNQRFLNPDHPAISADGLLVDQWGTPLDARTEYGGGFSLRSHGKDRKPDTADDILWPLPR